MSQPSSANPLEFKRGSSAESQLDAAEMAEIDQEIDKEIPDFKKGRRAVKVRERMDAKRVKRQRSSGDGADTRPSKKPRFGDNLYPTLDETEPPPSEYIDPTNQRFVASQFKFHNKTHYWSTKRGGLIPFEGDPLQKVKFAPKHTRQRKQKGNDSKDSKPKKEKKTFYSHQELLECLAVCIGKLELLIFCKMSEDGITEFLPESQLRRHFPDDESYKNLWRSVYKQSTRIRTEIFTRACKTVARYVQGRNCWPSSDVSDDARRQIWEREADTDAVLYCYFSNLMDAFDLRQLLNRNIPGNERLRAWVRHHLIFALESKWQQEQADSKLSKDSVDTVDGVPKSRSVVKRENDTKYRDWTDRVKHWARDLANSYQGEKPTMGEVTVDRNLFGAKTRPRRRAKYRAALGEYEFPDMNVDSDREG
jgi:hypothetical protein